MVSRLAPPLTNLLLSLFFLLPLLGSLLILFKVPALSLYSLFFKKKPHKTPHAVSRQVGMDMQHVERGVRSKRHRSRFLGTLRKRKEKLPLISKVYVMGTEGGERQEPAREKPHPNVHGRRVGVAPMREVCASPIKPVRSDPVHASSYLKKSRPINKREQERETLRKAEELERTLKEFGIDAKVTGIIRGPVITRYELQPAPGVKLSRIENLSNNIALNLSANGVRIEAPIPGRAAVGIEIPNDEREIVTLGDIIDPAEKKGELPLVLGKDISGNIVVSDLTAMPHLLIAGATGSGKSVCINSLVMSMISYKSPNEVRLLMIDPKMVELKIYNGIPHLLTEVVSDPRDAAKALRWVINEMENRYRLFDENYARNITGYNRKGNEPLPYLVIIVDELANLMAISQKEVEDAVVRLAAMSRAVGIHLIMATQRPSVDVITGLIKANFPHRIAFQVASKMDSRTILDTIGAEKLLGRGDMLYAPAGSVNIQRIQGAFISEDEVHKVVQELKRSTTPEYIEDIFSFSQDEGPGVYFDDPLIDQAIEIVLSTKRASASFLQRRLKIGYNRAARLIELMEEKGIIGPPRGSKPREIYIERMD
jgi:S-DNA-T family DNA segregation ATPase FtsK/SpoIIIE